NCCSNSRAMRSAAASGRAPRSLQQTSSDGPRAGIARRRGPGEKVARNMARGVAQPADADLRLYGILIGPAALHPHQSAAGVVALRAGRFEDDRLFHARAVAVHVEIPVVAAARSVCFSRPRTKARLDADHATRAAHQHSIVRSFLSTR